MKTVETAAEAYLQYEAFLEAGTLAQSTFISQDEDGREIACALGITGATSVSGCPAKVMPRWLAQMAPWFFDTQEVVQAFAWGKDFYAELKRLDGQVPFSVIHDWQATVVGKFAQESAEKHGCDVSVHKALAEMQWKALTGEKFSADDWRPVLKAAFLDVYKFRYRANADADADAYANAYANANANAYADANANANANAYANANANANANAYRMTVTMMAAGMVECLKRVPTPEAAA